MKQAQVIEYHLFRSVFLRLNRSLLTPAFDFSKYSGAIVDELIVRFFDVGWASWLLAVVVLFVTLPITVEVGRAGVGLGRDGGVGGCGAGDGGVCCSSLRPSLGR